MLELRNDAAYIRIGTEPRRDTATRLDGAILEMLQTPHTVESLRRLFAAASTDIVPDTPAIAAAMRRLLSDDLIELSPDS